MGKTKYINGISDSLFSKNLEQFCKTHETTEGESYINEPSRVITLDKCHRLRNRDIDNDKNMLPSKDYAEAILALCQLITIRDKEYIKQKYIMKWEIDWENQYQPKYFIYVNSNTIKIGISFTIPSVLSFPTRELAEKFLNTWRGLIEKAKILL